MPEVVVEEARGVRENRRMKVRILPETGWHCVGHCFSKWESSLKDWDVQREDKGERDVAHQHKKGYPRGVLYSIWVGGTNHSLLNDLSCRIATKWSHDRASSWRDWISVAPFYEEMFCRQPSYSHLQAGERVAETKTNLSRWDSLKQYALYRKVVGDWARTQVFLLSMA